MFTLAAFDLCSTTGCVFGFRLPFRLSSTPKGEPFRPGIYFIVEDIVAVDGNAGQPYRAALDERYRVSKIFRQMLVKLSFFWSVSALVVAAACTAVIYTTEDAVAFGIGECSKFSDLSGHR